MIKQLQIQGVAGLLRGEIAVDLFAGGGGASTGIEWSLGISPALAINHDPHAIEMHAANHPDTHHLCENVFDVKPEDAVAGRKIGLLWASPDCTHFSRAKGGKPRSQKIRGLAWIVVTWAAAVSPRLICLENVAEFKTWGPLDDEGKPIKARESETFREFISQLEALGYVVDHRVLNAADYGAPTARKRLFLVARRDGMPICWPEPTHGPGRALPYRTAAECIDWSLPCPSIFERKRPLAEATLRRIAEGIRRYVLEDPAPFIIPLTHGRDAFRGQRVDLPLPTVTAAHRGEQALVAANLIQASHGDWSSRPGARVRPLTKPLGTVTGSNDYAVVAAHLSKAHGHGWDREAGRSLDLPHPTIVAKGEDTLVAAHLTKFQENSSGQDAREPLHTVMAGAPRFGEVACLLKHYGGVVGQRLDKPTGTITAQDHHALLAAHVTKFYGTSTGSDMREPMPTITGQGGHAGLVAAFLLKYYSNGGQWSKLSEPMATIVGKARMGLVTVPINGEEYILADIGMRMLQPRELARAQGFPDSYLLTGTKTQQVARIGNSVCPPVAAAVVSANLSTAEVMA